MTDRAFLLHYARAMLAEARRRRGQAFGWVLLAWAANARCEAAAMPKQREMWA